MSESGGKLPLTTRAQRWAWGKLLIGSIDRGSRALRYAPGLRPERFGVRIVKDVPYLESGHRRAHTLDVYLPDGVPAADGAAEVSNTSDTSLPVVVYIHGGGFQFMDKRSHWSFATNFARMGYLTFNVNYRLAPRDPFPAGLEDVCAALRWVAANAGKWGGDPARMTWAGESAGANLTLAAGIAAAWRRPEPYAAALFEESPAPRALLPACGYLQVAEVGRHFEQARPARVIEGRIRVVADSYVPTALARDPSNALASPLVLLETALAQGLEPERPLAPVFALVGDKDPIIADTLRLGEVLGKLGSPNQIKVYAGGGHGFHAARFGDRARTALADQAEFVERALAR